jgi:hypothetical protein
VIATEASTGRLRTESGNLASGSASVTRRGGPTAVGLANRSEIMSDLGDMPRRTVPRDGNKR